LVKTKFLHNRNFFLLHLQQAFIEITENIPLGCYPFGQELPGRHFSSPIYRYGFNGKEKDDEVSPEGDGNDYDFGERIYDSRLGKWFSVDKLAACSPDWTPYRFGFNNPIVKTDPDGNYEADGSLSKTEKQSIRASHKQSGEKAWRRKASKEIAAKVKENVETIDYIIRGASNLLKTNPEATEAFEALTGTKRGDKNFENFFENNGKGPKIRLRDISDAASTDNGQITLSTIGHTALTLKVTILHEFVHYAGNKGFVSGDYTTGGFSNLVVGGRSISLQGQRQALFDARSSVNTSVLGNFDSAYSDLLGSGGVEGGYLFEKLAFGMIINQPGKAAVDMTNAFNERNGMKSMTPKTINLLPAHQN
jgi:RHS repeat-associated protein